MSVIPTALRKICPSCSATYSYDEAHSCTEGNSKLLIDDLPAVDPESLIGATLGDRYHIQGYLEGGGMGAVLRATHVTLLRPVAIKILVMREYQDTQAQQRFFQEAILASRIHHPNVIDIYDFGILEGGHLYLVMEYLEGRTLRQALRDGPLPPLRACHIGSQIARGLQAVHDEGIVHRDLKPDNIFLLLRDGHPDFVKIVDFGIAKARGGPNLTQSGMLLGTPLYMAPEQIGGTPTDHRVDQYSLGCVLYRMLTASLPFDSPDTAELLSMHVRSPVHPPRDRRPDLPIPPSLEAVVLRLLAKRPEDRFAHMREVADALGVEMERLGERRESTRLRTGSGALSIVTGAHPLVTGSYPYGSGPLQSGSVPTLSGPLPAASGGLQRLSGSMPVVQSAAEHGEPSSQTRLLPQPVLDARPAWRRLIVPVALGIGAGGVALFLMVALGSRPPEALVIDPVQAQQLAPRAPAVMPSPPPAPAPQSLQSTPPSIETPAAAEITVMPAPAQTPPLPATAAPDLAVAPDPRSALTAAPNPQAGKPVAVVAAPPKPAVTPLQKPRQDLTVRFEVKSAVSQVLISCASRPPVRCEGNCVVTLPEGAGDCVASAPGSGYRPESYPLSALRALPRDGKGPPTQPVQLRYIRLQIP